MTLSGLSPSQRRTRSALEVDRHAVGEDAAAVERNAEQFAHLAVRAVGADQILARGFALPRRCRRPAPSTVTPSASCSKPTTSCPSQQRGADLSARACAGSARGPGWMTNSRRHRAQRLHALVEARDDVGELAPGQLSITMSAPSGTNSFSRLLARPRPRCRRCGTSRACACGNRGPRQRRAAAQPLDRERGMPCCARNIAVDRPIRPPPAIRTGTSRSIDAPFRAIERPSSPSISSVSFLEASTPALAASTCTHPSPP